MTAIANELSGQVRGPFGALRRSMTRDELFAGVYFLACVNGLWGRVLIASREAGWWSTVFHLDISAIVLLACVAGVWLILDDNSGEIRRTDVAVAVVFVTLVMLPIFALSWLTVTGLSFYILRFANDSSSRKRGALILFAITIPMLWTPLMIQFFERPMLAADTALVAWVNGSDRIGDLVRFAQGPGYVQIAPGCASITNLSLAILCWVGVTQWANHRWSPEDILWCFLACFSAVAINVIRMAAMAHSAEFYELLHNQHWDLTSNIANGATLVVSIGFSALGSRRELFSHA